MKNIIKLTSLLICLLFVGCGTNSPETESIVIDDTTKEVETTTQVETTPYMIMYKGNLYVDTGETNSIPRCGNLDFSLKYTGSLDKIPNKNGQANFQASGGQHSWRDNRIEVFVDDQWHIFAYNEGGVDGVSMKVLNHTNTAVKLEISNDTNLDIQYDDYFILEKKDTETNEWFIFYPIIDDYAFKDIAYKVQKNSSAVRLVELEWLYGKLDIGTYRIVKIISSNISENDHNNNSKKYWYSAEFTVDG